MTMSEKKRPLHPFGKKLAYYLRQTDISQTNLANATDIAHNVLSNMKYGERLSGEGARERILRIIQHFHELGVITTHQEANEFLATAGMLPLTPQPFDKLCSQLEPMLYNSLKNGAETQQDNATSRIPQSLISPMYPTSNLTAPSVSPSQSSIPPVSTRLQPLTIPKKARLPLLISLFFPVFIIPLYLYLTNGWHVRINYTDDINVILVNDIVVDVDNGRSGGLPSLVSLNPYFTNQEPITLTLVNLNGIYTAKWDFELRYNNTLMWHQNRMAWEEYQLNFVQKLLLTEDGNLQLIPPPVVANPITKPITLSLDVEEFAIVYINNYPRAGATDSPSGEFSPMNISPFLEQGIGNTLEIKFVASPGPYKWLVEIQNGESVWQCVGSGHSESGIQLSEQFIVDETGNLVYGTPQRSCQQF